MATTIIFGSRGITGEYGYAALLDAIKRSGFAITEVVEGECKNSPDLLGKRYAQENNIPCVEFPAKWDDLSHKDAIIRKNYKGKEYDARAGFRRNQDMVDYATHSPDSVAIGLWNGTSNGSTDMEQRVLRAGLKCYFVRVPQNVVTPPEWTPIKYTYVKGT
jgi:hypothetical protein